MELNHRKSIVPSLVHANASPTSVRVWRWPRSVGDFGWLYFAVANIIGLPLVAAGVLMVRGAGRRWAYRVFKLTAFPFLGLTYLGLAVDVLARGA